MRAEASAQIATRWDTCGAVIHCDLLAGTIGENDDDLKGTVWVKRDCHCTRALRIPVLLAEMGQLQVLLHRWREGQRVQELQ